MRATAGARRIPWLVSLLLLLLTPAACSQQEQVLPFETIAQREVINYREEQPALFIIASAAEVDDLAPNVLTEDRWLADQLSALDYDRVFAILVLHGYVGSTGFSVTVQRIMRQGDQVTVWAEFLKPVPGTRIKPAFTSPYHLVAVSKEGSWGREIRFVLMVGEQSVAESTQFVP